MIINILKGTFLIYSTLVVVVGIVGPVHLRVSRILSDFSALSLNFPWWAFYNELCLLCILLLKQTPEWKKYQSSGI